MARFSRIILIAAFIALLKAEDDLKDFEFSDPDEVMIAQESRHYQTIVKPPVHIVKPTGVTNSHRPQYDLESFEDRSDIDLETSTKKTLVKNYKSSHKIRSKEGMVKDAVLRALDRKDHVGKFAQILPIIRAMSGNQRVALASLVASQVTTPPGRAPLNLSQVRSMFGNSANTTELMLPILLDTANLIRRAIRPGKMPREVIHPYEPPKPQLLRRSFIEDEFDDEPFDIGVETTTQAIRNRRITQRQHTNNTNIGGRQIHSREANTTLIDSKIDRNATQFSTSTTTEPTTTVTSFRRTINSSRVPDNATLDLMADSTNLTLAQDLPVAEKLRALNRYTDRKGAQFRRGIYPPSQPKPLPVSPMSRRTTAEPMHSSITRRRPMPARKLPVPSSGDPNKCELFTNTLCLQSEDYPTDAIVQSIRRNKAAAAALLADFRDPGEGALDGITAAQEAKYTEQHYLVSNRRGDTASRDFASAGEAGFMCPSTVKYARPQRARATSGQWKYIVNTGEHTQTLRLEKCLKPKEPCTYLTDNFKSKCVQVYNYHRLLTWDQQNGLHMDIFKVPTCCSCHIEGYSVSFPPLGHRLHETSSEHFPGEDLSSEQGNHALEAVQSTVQRPHFKSPPFTRSKPLESFPPFTDNQNLISGIPFSKHNEDDSLPSNPEDSYGNTYFPDSFNQASSIRNVKRPPSARNPTNLDSVTLPSYLEPPTPEATSSFNFGKDSSKYKLPGSQFKRTVRPSRRPIRKKISGGSDDLLSSGTSALETFPSSSGDTSEDGNDYEETENGQAAIMPKKNRVTISPKLQALTTEKQVTSPKPKELNAGTEIYTVNGKRVNYNYHPIIDFFDEEKEINDESIDREDSEPSYIQAAESEWKPINHLPSRNGQSNSVGRKKHK